MVRNLRMDGNGPCELLRRYASRELPGVSVSDVRYRAAGRQRFHDHPYSAVTLIVDGALEERGRASVHHARAASVVVKPAGTVHANAYGPRGTRTLQVAWDGAADGTPTSTRR